jgi:hypothetical protein
MPICLAASAQIHHGTFSQITEFGLSQACPSPLAGEHFVGSLCISPAVASRLAHDLDYEPRGAGAP